MRVFGKRWRWWALLAAAVVVLLFFSSLLWVGTGLTESRARRIIAGMTRQEVEAVIGQPHHIPDLERHNAAFWDSLTLFGCHYVSLTVYYDSEGKVDKTLVGTYWRDPWDVVRAKLKL
jgi:hypothetical protein